MFLFDTNVLSELATKRPDPRVRSRFLATPAAHRQASVVTLQELRYGASLHPLPDWIWAKVEREILPWVRWLEFGEGAAFRAGCLQAQLEKAGRLIGTEDVQMAATALHHGLVLVTRNTRHFDHVPELRVENWFEAPGSGAS